jgi:hypothetical protein
MSERCYPHLIARCFPPGVPVFVSDGAAVLASRLARAWEDAWSQIGAEARNDIQSVWWWRWSGGCEPARVEVLPRIEGTTADCSAAHGLFRFSYAVCLEMPDRLLPVLVAHELAHVALWACGENRGGLDEEEDVDELCRAWGFDVDGLARWAG